MDAIRTENLTRTFGRHRAVDGLTLSVAEGEIFGLVGPDGAGKTTTLRMLAGILDGHLRRGVGGGLDVREGPRGGEGPDRLHEPALRPLRRSHRDGEHRLLRATSTACHRAERARGSSGSWTSAAWRPSGRRRAGDLSGGMKQKLGLCCALVHTPQRPLPGRAHQRRGSRLPPRLLAHPLPAPQGAGDHPRLHRLPGRGRALRRVGLMHRGRLLACDTPGGRQAA